MIKLKRCPFCGKNPDTTIDHVLAACEGKTTVTIKCVFCKVYKISWVENEEFEEEMPKIIELWNTRAKDDD